MNLIKFKTYPFPFSPVAHSPISPPIFSRIKFFNKKMTFVEAMVSALILGLILAMGFRALQQGNKVSSRQNQVAIMQNEVRGFFLKFQKDIHEATGFKELLAEKLGPFYGKGDATLKKLVILKGIETITYEYVPGEKTLYRQSEGGARRPVLYEQLESLQLWGVDFGYLPPRSNAASIQQNYLNHLSKLAYTYGHSDLKKVKGVVIRLVLNEYEGKVDGVDQINQKVLHQRVFETKLYSRTLNFKKKMEF